ncbi:SURF1 family protein [Legionella clemsonensis]|uniref:SURF1-like protein n=1 Tax=Legionella clemsonensis TaxID=1867846 RepID=A0A222P068_9GAMM|nr:SURF1 family protein [Legionella clemsonensis]ASQ45229.1 SURF1 family protein [Legionella clemsonensis]
MLSLTCFNRRFTPNWKMAVLTCIGILFFSRLGFWQLHRAQEKKQMLTTQARFSTASPVLWQPGVPLPKQYQRIVVTGKFLPKTILLDNQHYQHQFGYNILTPLLLSSGSVVLVDRGWMAGELSRQTFPSPKVPDEVLNIAGNVYYPSKNWLMGAAFEKKQNIILIERIDTDLLSQLLHKTLYPFIIRLDKAEAHGYVREWAIVAMPPERHYAYAVQWFALAFVCFILFVALNFKKLNENDPT